MLPTALSLENVRATRGRFVAEFEHVALERGGILAVVGPSGCGKTTLLDIVAGRMKCEGTVLIDGVDVSREPAFRRSVHTCWQTGGETLFPHLSAGANAEYALRIAGVPTTDRRRSVQQLFESMGLAGLYDRKVSQLSGGQRQRVAIIRALARRAPLILLDEVTTGLDPHLRREMRTQLTFLASSRKVAMIYVTHDLGEAAHIAGADRGRILILRAGRIEQCGQWDEVYSRPRSSFVARFTGAANLFVGTGVSRLVVGVAASAPAGSSVTAVRPEHMRLVDPLDGNAILRGTVCGVETDRGAFDVTFDVGGRAVSVRLWPRDSIPSMGEEWGLTWDHSNESRLESCE